MKPNNKFSPKRQEAGVALLIAIFILLLVSGVALALVANSGTESSLAGNYRSSTSAYDAGFAGLEEARGRLLPGSPNALNAIPGFIPTPLAVNQVRYILNPLIGEVVAPANLGNNATYPDTEYAQEFTPGLAGATVQTTNSVWANSAVAQMPGPLYKWVRITAATEQSLNIDVNRDGIVDGLTAGTVATPLYYDAAPASGAKPSLIEVPVGVVPPSTASQVYEVTALAALPNGTRKLEQYVVTPVTLNLNFPSALTLGGKIGIFQGANSNPYQVNGQDGSGTAPAVPGCNPNPATSLPAIGVTDPPGGPTTDKTTVTSGIPRPTHYTGGGLATPSVGEVTLNSTLSTPSELDQLVQTITQNADAVLSPPSGTSATASQLPPSTIASPCTPSTAVVNGDFDLGPNTGCGLLVVTGNFLYQGNSGWNGIILVIGSGTTTFQGNGGGNGQFDGAIFVATTKDAAGNPLPALGTVNFDISGGGGNGIYYNSCWVNKVQQPPTYKVLSFHEIAQ